MRLNQMLEDLVMFCCPPFKDRGIIGVTEEHIGVDSGHQQSPYALAIGGDGAKDIKCQEPAIIGEFGAF